MTDLVEFLRARLRHHRAPANQTPTETRPEADPDSDEAALEDMNWDWYTALQCGWGNG